MPVAFNHVISAARFLGKTLLEAEMSGEDPEWKEPD